MRQFRMVLLLILNSAFSACGYVQQHKVESQDVSISQPETPEESDFIVRSYKIKLKDPLSMSAVDFNELLTKLYLMTDIEFDNRITYTQIFNGDKVHLNSPSQDTRYNEHIFTHIDLKKKLDLYEYIHFVGPYNVTDFNYPLFVITDGNGKYVANSRASIPYCNGVVCKGNTTVTVTTLSPDSTKANPVPVIWFQVISNE